MEFHVLLPPLFSSFTVSDNDNACEPQLCNFYDCTSYVNLLGYECGPGFSGVIASKILLRSLLMASKEIPLLVCSLFPTPSALIWSCQACVLMCWWAYLVFPLVLLHMLFGTCISNVLRLVRLQLGLPLSLHGLFGFGGARGSTEL
nr:hypothetical protein CFP56_49208 [Quercus suber]